MKKTLGRLGTVTVVVGLVTAGLVELAGPAQAGEINKSDFVGLLDCDAAQQAVSDDDFETYNLESLFEPACNRKGLAYVGYTRQQGQQFLVYAPFGCPIGEPCQSVNAGDEPGESEPVQTHPPPPPCWSAEALNNCPVGGALRFAAPKYAMVGVPLTMYAYASWRPDANSPAQPTNGTAVIRVDGEDYSGVEFVDGVAEWRFIPETEGMKEFTASGVVFSGLSGANAYIDTVEARTYVLEYDPAAYAKALKNKRVEVGDTYVITDPNQARSYLKDRYEWSVSETSDDVCAVYETKKGAVKAKFTDSGKCTVIWLDKESEEKGKYTFIAKK